MDNEIDLLKKTIKKTLENTISTIDPAFNLDDAIDTYIKVLDYEMTIPRIDELDGLMNSKIPILTRALVNRDYSEESSALIGVFNQRFESFIKKLYFTLEEFGEISNENRVDLSKPNAISPFLTSLNKSNPYYLDIDNNPTIKRKEAKIDKFQNPVLKLSNGQNQYLRLYSTSISFTQYIDPYSYDLSAEYLGKFEYHFLRSYILRNKECHSSPLVNIVDLMNNLQSTLITELWFVHFFKEKLNFGILQSHGEKMDFDQYIDKESSRLKDQFEKFVPLSLRLYSNQNNNEPTTIEDLINTQNFRLRILGEGGSGKTTTLESIVYKKCIEWKENKTEKIPVLLFLANLKKDESIIDSIANKISVQKEIVQELIKGNKIILLLDGINEIVKDRESKKERLKEIAVIIEENKLLEIIVTDRYEFDSYQNDPFKIPSYGLEKLNDIQIKGFVEKYCLNTEHSPDRVYEILISKPNIKLLLTRPLLLSRCIEIIKFDNELPEKEGRIIEKFIDLMLKREKDEKMDPLLNITNFKLLLSFVANSIFVENKTNTPINEFKCLKLINEGAEKLGLEKFNAGYTLRIGFELEILSKKDELIQFYHQTYFEYFVKHFTLYELN